ncbi:hypothetical protein [Clostridium botulinum]|uniref:Uncharacterized protein n=1 Tax=Clostridium botulinum CFSAN001627 TaxID=1232189 RepID=M1ZUA8_CLOBO|nr:hypothetical protein [Clostridium botulinum]EKN42986.1 hypothetical protein CFSAN001627_03675 [Clostridium botulinum CFSAN001627]MBY6850364.1 hypothetical protein [Clostridium botulinum]MBY6857424.1 hypothetical protein [Clostridium botulinum]MBY6967394.1 hypothetical protein [Clostridium botulinum]HBJ1686156.1 hypothetical protein [Clostridium botulinum]
MENKEFDIKKLFAEPNFSVDPQKYIKRYKKLLNDIEGYINNLEVKIQNETGIAVFGLTSELILAEYQKELIKQVMNNFNFYSK